MKMDITYLINLTEAIVKSPAVEQYNVGITKDPSKRRNQYWRGDKIREYDHFVILEWGLSHSEAQYLEEIVFTELTRDQERVTYRKYKHSVRDQGYRRSFGGYTPKPDDTYDLYIAWWEP
jgi:hypothetical protein